MLIILFRFRTHSVKYCVRKMLKQSTAAALVLILISSHLVLSCEEKAVACEHNADVTVSCPKGKVLDVMSAFYGRKDSKTCGSESNTNCVAHGSSDKIKDLCHDKNSCTLSPTNDVYGDPCAGVGKYIEMKYKCVDEVRYVPKSVVACEKSDATLSCGENEVIVVTNGFYGRDNSNTCPGDVKTTTCAATGSLDILRRTCNNKRSCKVSAKNSVFGDPCVGTKKFIRMEYYCVKKLVKDIAVRNALACEHHDSVNVHCPAGEVMIIASGFYGRDEAQSCPGNIHTTQCRAEGSETYLKCKCNNEWSCLLQASNDVFGDPCPQTNKLIKLEYYCVPHAKVELAVACEYYSTTLVACPDAKKITFIDGFYGRDEDTSTCPGKIKTSSCVSVQTRDHLKQTCGGKNVCTLRASNSVFGDPCGGTSKFIKMFYECA